MPSAAAGLVVDLDRVPKGEHWANLETGKVQGPGTWTKEGDRYLQVLKEDPPPMKMYTDKGQPWKPKKLPQGRKKKWALILEAAGRLIGQPGS